MAESRLLTELFLTAIFCGSIACWLLKVEDTLIMTLGAGALGIYIEPWIGIDIGPKLFDYHLLSSLIGAVIAAFVLGILHSVVRAWSASTAKDRRQLHTAASPSSPGR